VPTRNPLTQQEAALKHGFRSGLEEEVAAYLQQEGVDFAYEELVLPYVKPEKKHRYTPDYLLHNGIVLETKGRWVTADRQKMALIKAQYPDLDIRMCFNNPNARISKGSPTTYAMICLKLGIPFCAKKPPLAWLREPVNEKSQAVVMALLTPRKAVKK
jgi:hypothetical protein